MVEDLIKERGTEVIPSATPEEWNAIREEYKKIFIREVYGTPLPEPEELTFEAVPAGAAGRGFCAGKVQYRKIVAKGKLNGREFSFPFVATIPTKKGKYPFFILNNFRDLVPDKYFPTEEVLDGGFAVLTVCYKDVTSDDGDFTNGLAGVLYPDGKRTSPTDPGKIAMWAWANMRLMDYAMTLDCLDHDNGAVIGHSRLGKTALLTGMLDTRFRYVIANDSGCTGDALTRGKEGEHVADICKTFPYWFCENYLKYVDETKLTFDQHMFLATIAPRTVLTGAAIEDIWADPASQYLSAIAASKAWENHGLQGLVHPDRLPVIGDNFDDGCICYHLRDGRHYLSREDWNVYMNTIRKKMGN